MHVVGAQIGEWKVLCQCLIAFLVVSYFVSKYLVIASTSSVLVKLIVEDVERAFIVFITIVVMVHLALADLLADYDTDSTNIIRKSRENRAWAQEGGVSGMPHPDVPDVETVATNYNVFLGYALKNPALYWLIKSGRM